MYPCFFHIGVALVRFLLQGLLYSRETLVFLMGKLVVLMVFSRSLDSFLAEVVLGGIG